MDPSSLASLIPSLIHPRAPASIAVYRRSLSSQRDLYGPSCTVIRNPEKRKVGGSTPPLTTSSDLRKRLFSNQTSAVGYTSSLILVSFISSGRSPVRASSQVSAHCTRRRSTSVTLQPGLHQVAIVTPSTRSTAHSRHDILKREERIGADRSAHATVCVRRASKPGASLTVSGACCRGGESVFGFKPIDEPAEITNRGQLADDALP